MMELLAVGLLLGEACLELLLLLAVVELTWLWFACFYIFLVVVELSWLWFACLEILLLLVVVVLAWLW